MTAVPKWAVGVSVYHRTRVPPREEDEGQSDVWLARVNKERTEETEASNLNGQQAMTTLSLKQQRV